MENKDYYLLKDVILGLRSEYLILEKKLAELKKAITYDKQNIKDINFVLRGKGKGKDTYELYCKLKFRIHDIKSLLYSCVMNMNFKNNNINMNDIYNNENLTIEDVNYFKYSINNILSSDIIKNMPISEDIEKNNFKGLFVATPSVLGMYNYNDETRIPNIIYFSHGDTIRIYDLNDRVFSDSISDALSLQIPKGIFSDYQRNIIENNDDVNKQLIIPNNLTYFKSDAFKISEENNKLYLKKVK